MDVRNHLRLIVLIASVAFAADASAQGVAADSLAERMLSAIGGRGRWAEIKNTVNDSWQSRLQEPTRVRAIITMDFETPRFRIENSTPHMRMLRVIDGNQNWRLTDRGTADSIPQAIVAEDMRWYSGHVYRTIHRIAARDRALTLSIDARGRLQAFEGGRRIIWFALDARGEPYAFGSLDDETGSITGPWDFVRDGIHHPAWVSRPDGSWRARIVGLGVNVPLNDSLFSRPPQK